MQTRNYSLFRKVGKRYEQVSPHAYSKQMAVRVFQDRLLSDFSLSLRPVKQHTSTTPANHVLCSECQQHFHMECKRRGLCMRL